MPYPCHRGMRKITRNALVRQNYMYNNINYAEDDQTGDDSPFLRWHLMNIFIAFLALLASHSTFSDISAVETPSRYKLMDRPQDVYFRSMNLYRDGVSTADMSDNVEWDAVEVQFESKSSRSGSECLSLSHRPFEIFYCRTLPWKKVQLKTLNFDVVCN